MLAIEISNYNQTIHSISNWASSYPSNNYLPSPLYLTNEDMDLYLLKPKISINFNQLHEQYIDKNRNSYHMSSKNVINTPFTNKQSINDKNNHIKSI